MTKEELKKIGVAISEKLIDVECPMCHSNSYIIVDSYTMIHSYGEINQSNPDERVMPLVMLVCANCGHVSFHSAGILGLMNNNENKEESKDKGDKSSSDDENKQKD